MKLLFSFCFSLATVTGFFLDRGIAFENMTIPAFAIFLVAAAASTCVVFFVTGHLLRGIQVCGKGMTVVQMTQERHADQRGIRLQWPLVTLLLLLCWLPLWLAYWPGFWNYDANVIKTVLAGAYNTHHPLIHTVFLGICYAFGKMMANENGGIILYTAIQMLIMAGIFSYTICFLFRFLRRAWTKALLFLFYALFPLHALMALSPTKDVLFAGWVTLLAVLFLRSLFDSEGADNTPSAAVCTGLLILILLTRHNGLVGLLLLLAAMLLLRKRIAFPPRQKKLLFLSLLLYLCFSTVLKTGLQASSGPDAEMYSISIQQFGRIHEYGNEEEREIVERFFDYGEAFYIPSISDPMKKTMRPGNRGAFFLQSAKWAVQHPLLTLDAWLYLTKGHWDIDDRAHTEQYRAINSLDLQGYLATSIYRGYGVERSSLLPELGERYTSLFAENEIFDIPLLRNIFAPAFWHWLFLFCALAWYTYAPKQASVYLLFPGGILVSLLAAPCALIRYSYLFVTCAPLLFVFSFVFAGSVRE